MERRTRGEIAMGTSAEDFSLAHPLQSPGYQAAVAGLSKALAEARALEIQQREGFIAERSGGAVRRELMERMRQVHLPHLTHSASRAEREQPDLTRKFRYKPTSGTLGARRAAAASMVEAAQNYKEVLVRHGMEESVLDDLVRTLAGFDAASEQSIAGRAAHVGASARLRAVGQEIVGLVRVLDGLNRVRFKDDEALLAQWASMSSVRAVPRGGGAEGAGPAPAGAMPAGAPGSSPEGEITRPAA